MQIQPANQLGRIQPNWLSLDSSDWLQAETERGELGLRLTKVGKNSPLRQLELQDFVFCGTAEIGDMIVAINGVAVTETSELKHFQRNDGSCELSIFDFRTRQTVTWQMRLGTTNA
jgi:predicted metalloprotease with PDZ domain